MRKKLSLDGSRRPFAVSTLMSSMTIGRRLALGFGLVLVLFAGTTGFGVLQISRLQEDMAVVIQSAEELNGAARQMRDQINASYMDVLLAAQSTQRDDIKFQTEQLREHIDTYITARKELLSRTHEGRDIPGMAELVKPLTESESVLHVMKSASSDRLAQANATGDDSYANVPLNDALVSNVVNQVKANGTYFGRIGRP